ncbi:MAG: GNAT family N-acetyltransferase [Acidimicrobiia bacterium]
MGDFVVAMDSPDSSDVQSLLEAHLAFASEQSPPEDVHALDTRALLEDDISFFSLREDGRLLGVGAIKELDPTHGELKSIHTAASARGTGVGRTMVNHLIDLARQRGYQRVSLETGTMDAFVASRRLYSSLGFEECEPFGSYWHSVYSVCMTLDLSREG